MNFLAEFLIGLIVGTQGITVQDQDLTAIQLDDCSSGSRIIPLCLAKRLPNRKSRLPWMK
ncbi:Uncharacterised protein [Serratia fonticola]|uniref:Uncharacterized protein n=1 Tax=Serratia fonticola TaxID=47917 RepID=A0A4U9TZN7_SERFO|nr:Uncharacterised protein [Serratia fonticola]